MKLRILSVLFSVITFVAAVTFAAGPVFAAPSCGSYQVVGSQCATTVLLAWGTAGGTMSNGNVVNGTDSLITFFIPPTVSASVTYQLIQLNSSLGAEYGGFFGTFGSFLGGTPKVQTASNSPALTGAPGNGAILHITNVCFDPTCTAAPPAGAVSDMFSAEFQVLAASGADLDILVPPLLTVRFLTNGVVVDEEQETASAPSTRTQFVVDSLAEGATAANRYVYTNASAGSVVTAPFVAFSVTNPSPSQTVTGTLTLYGTDGTTISTVQLPSIPPLGAIGYLLVGRFPGDTLGLFPSSTVLPDPTNSGTYHGALFVQFSGPAVFLAQEYNGNAMLNLVVF